MFGKDIMSLKVEMDVPMFRRGKQQLFSKTNERSDRKSRNRLRLSNLETDFVNYGITIS